MHLFDAIKNKIFGRRADYADIRAGVLNEPMVRPPPDTDRFGPPEDDISASRSEVPPLPEPFPERGPISLGEERPAEREENYEVVDRLNFIQNQLSAIKSQTETINERLKNLEMKVGRRY